MKYKWFARFFAAVFTASVLLQPGNAVYAVQDVAVETETVEAECAETESAETEEGAESTEPSAEESAEQPEAGSTELQENGGTEELLPEGTELTSGENGEAVVEESVELPSDGSGENLPAESDDSLAVDGLNTAEDGNGAEFEEDGSVLENMTGNDESRESLGSKTEPALSSSKIKLLPIKYLSSATQFIQYDIMLSEDEIQKSYVLLEGSLPKGLVLTTDGKINGVPMESGYFGFDVQITEGENSSIYKQTCVLSVEKNMEYIASGTYEDILWYIDPNGKLIVSGTGNYSYGENHYVPWYEYRGQITSAEIDITEITNIARMFDGCNNLCSVDLSRLDTSNVTSMRSMFAGCNNLVNVDLSQFDTGKVTDMSEMFSNCNNLQNLNLSGFDTGNVISMRSMFAECTNLVNVDMSQFNTSKVTDMSEMFSNCNNLQNIDLSSFDTENVTYMSKMFSGCSAFTSLDLSSFDVRNVKNMDLGLGLNLKTIKTPCNVADTITLPTVPGDVWLLPSRDEITELPQNLDYSVTVTRETVEQETIRVSNAEELKAAIGSSKCIILADGLYELEGGLWLYQEGNLVIKAENPGKAEILSHDGYSAVITLDCCNNIEITGCVIGHEIAMEDEYGCGGDGEVIRLNGGSSVIISGCDLYGCGTMGVWCSGIKNVNIENCVIRDCMYNIVYLSENSNFTIKNSIMSGNGYKSSSRVGFASVYDNSIAECNLVDCIFLENHNSSFVSSNRQKPTMTGCIFQGNAWDNQEPKQSGICLNGLTWQIEGDTLKLGFPLQFDDGTVIESTQTEPLPYSAFSLPWKNCSYQRTVKAWEAEEPGNTAVTLEPAVKYAPYDSHLADTENLSVAILFGALPSGLSLAADGRLSGVPTESGDFSFTVQKTNNADGSSREETYTLSVNENTESNFDIYADPGYELTELVPNLYFESIPEEGSQLMVSVGPFEEFTALYLDGEKLTEGVDYTAQSGSTRITIQNQTLKRKGPGGHTLAMEFRTADSGALKWAAQNYIIAEGKDPAAGGDNNQSNNGGTTDNNSGNNNTTNDTNHSNTTAVVENTSSTIAYTVQFGDTLSKIAQRFYGSSRSWRRIYTDNAATIRNPNRIYPGQVLIITLDQNNNAASGTAAKTNTSNTALNGSYTVVSGDNLFKIAQKVYGQGGRWNEIYQANKSIIANPARIYAGQVLIIP